MTIEEQIFATLETLVDGRVFPDFAPNGTALPFIVYQNVGGQPFGFLDGAVLDKEFSRVQVSTWCGTRLEASALGKLVEDTLRAAPDLQAEVLTGRPATYDEETGYRGTRQDFNFFT